LIAGGEHTRQAANAFDQLAVERFTRRGRGVAFTEERQIRSENSFHLVSAIGVRHVDEAVEQQAGGGQQHCGERRLDGYERLSRAAH
jgi:hypothetical protein